CGKTGNERHIVYGFQRVTKRQDSTESVKIQPVSQGAGFFFDYLYVIFKVKGTVAFPATWNWI
ncbi:hypothetical protein, partial [Faecalibaculum rodentium]|uniref:hypothetical protein n=1 Tax=Faecalibaculum rodentium TaxID=1702221 RepID=UPI002670A6AE